VLVPLLWNLLATIFNVAQACRLLGIVVGVLGSTAVAALSIVLQTRALLLVSSGVLLAMAVVLVWTRDEQGPLPRPTGVLPSRRDLCGTAMLGLVADGWQARTNSTAYPWSTRRATSLLMKGPFTLLR
jgi:hypothetical protein